MAEANLTEAIVEHIRKAGAERQPLRIVGSDSKAFYGGVCTAQQTLSLAGHCGVIAYEPSELVVTARAGTPLAHIDALLAERGQMLGFEPPAFAANASLGGAMACGFSGPRRPFAGSARDFMLGCRLVNGRGEVLNFGGRVIKNVAGFDVSRLMVGGLGTLGALLDISLRTLPRPDAEITVLQHLNAADASAAMSKLQQQPWPISALSFYGGALRIRLSGAASAIAAAATRIGGDPDPSGTTYWQDLREQRLAFFAEPGDLWRLSVAPAAPLADLPGPSLLDWGGALRWVKTAAPAADIHAAAARAGGHATLWRGSDKTHWLRIDPALAALQSRLRAAFDPLGILNPGRLPF